jgi:exonuclease SbcD
MRFLHTGDWHVGRTLRGRSRADEFAAALDAVVDIAAAENVDAVLVAGDIYDQRSVSPEADRVIFETLIRLGEHDVRVVAVPGNHDSAPRLEALAPLLERVGTVVVPKVRRADGGALVDVHARDGSESAAVACLPFVSPRRFSDAAALFDDVATGFVNFDENMGVLLRAYEQAFRPGAVNIVLGHMFLSGSEISGSERQITVGSEYAVSPSRLPGTASYIALGHIHKPQRITAATAQTRYCGSLLQLDFGERGQDKSVTIVDVAAGKPPKVSTIPVKAGRRLLDVEGKLEDLERIAAEVGDAYLRVTLNVERPVPGIADRVRASLPNALDVKLELPQRDEERPRESLQGLDPKQQFVSYYQAQHGREPADSLLTAFDHVYEEVVG